jgi:hypothetical protein
MKASPVFCATCGAANPPDEQFSENGRWYLVMDFIEGETLEARLSHAPGGRLPVPEVVQIGVQLCTVLEYLHTRQPPIIFRDLKPANIMVTPTGDLSLIDFGSARLFKPGQTKDTTSFGSAGYAAPEQYGKAQTTTQSDIYSLGATLHQLLSGSDPANSPFLFAPLNRAEPEGLKELIEQMLATDPAKRPASVAVIKRDLARMVDDLATGRKRQEASAAPGMSPSGEVLRPLVLYRGHFDSIHTVAWSPDGKYIASGGRDQTVHIWESASGKKHHVFPQRRVIFALAWSPAGSPLAWVNGGREVHYWSTQAKNFSSVPFYRVGFMKGLLALAWSPDGSRLVASGMGRTVEVWDAKTGKYLLSYEGHKGFFHGSEIYTVVWSPDGEWIASAGLDAKVQVWQAATGQLRCTYSAYQVLYSGGIAWSPDSRFLATAGDRYTVDVRDSTTGRLSLVLKGHSGSINAVAWSPDGMHVASGGSDHAVRVWDVAVGKQVLVYEHRQGEVNAVAWSPDGTRIASAGDDHVVHVWRAR